MALETVSPSSRRALLAGALGAVAASAVAALGRPPEVRAGSGLFESATQGVAAVTATNTAGGEAFGVHSTSGSAEGRGVFGYVTSATGYTYGVYARTDSSDGRGVYSIATAGTGSNYGLYGSAAGTSGYGAVGVASASTGNTHGVYGQANSTAGTAVRGYAIAASGPTRGVYGRVDSPEGTGVLGYSGTAVDPAPVAKTGVYGYSAQDADARGVWGRSAAGRGVYGQASTGQGVRGYSATGSALYGATSGLKKGFALRAIGRVKLDNCAGLTSVAAGATVSAVVSPGIDLTSTSAVTATLQGSAGVAGVAVARVAIDTAADTFRVYLTASNTSGSPVKVAWHVFG